MPVDILRGSLNTAGHTPIGVAPRFDLRERLTPSEDKNMPISNTLNFLNIVSSFLPSVLMFYTSIITEIQ